MDKSSALVWKTARRQFEGLPDCPADLTEQEYTDLAFSARCDVRTNSSERLTWREMSHRAVENMPISLSGKCGVGIV